MATIWLLFGYATETNSDQNNLSSGRKVILKRLAEGHKANSSLVRYISSNVLAARGTDGLAE